MSAAPVLLLFGAGANVGQSVARAFAAKGYKIALVSRSQKDNTNIPNAIHISSDLSDPSSVPGVFAKVSEKLGTPSVVVYNAAAVVPTKPEDPLSNPTEHFIKDLNINTTSAYNAGQQAVLGFQKLPATASKTFIYTGNLLNTSIIVPYLDLGVGKSATAHIIQVAAEAYKDKGYKFYYADERKADGSSAGQEVDGDAHAELYVVLAEGKAQGPWQQTFVKGKGYQKF
ncbi:NAD(P)-binding protein [Byssothecium circinans]|uniref:NAD(P)-binding protein n=1 Tax=Byssothecium circinans TaxID=147558 RepID=A0A6A5UIQ2_9PLEO|nr:NAD(P)-binding protein [Byssothecium circinans]